MAKKIMLIHNILWSHYKAIVLSELDVLIKACGNELYVIHIAPKGVTQKNLGDADRSLHKYHYKVLFYEYYELISNVKKCIALWREIRSYKPDIIVLPGFGEIPFWFVLLASKVLTTRSILTCDSTSMDRPAFWLKTTLKKLFVRGCSTAFCYGTKSKEYLLSLGMPIEAIYTRCQAIDNEKFAALWKESANMREQILLNSGFKSRNFIFVGRLIQLKNIIRLIDAFTNLKQNEELAADWGLIVVGDGPQREELIKHCTQNAVKDVNLIGGKNWSETPSYYALADVFVLPSTSEAWGLVVNEAMICGLPVLVSDRCGAAYDLVEEGKNGFVFNPFDVLELENRLRFFVRNPDEIGIMSERSRAIISDYTAQNAALQMLRGIRDTLEMR